MISIHMTAREYALEQKVARLERELSHYKRSALTADYSPDLGPFPVDKTIRIVDINVPVETVASVVAKPDTTTPHAMAVMAEAWPNAGEWKGGTFGHRYMVSDTELHIADTIGLLSHLHKRFIEKLGGFLLKNDGKRTS